MTSAAESTPVSQRSAVPNLEVDSDFSWLKEEWLKIAMELTSEGMFVSSLAVYVPYSARCVPSPCMINQTVADHDTPGCGLQKQDEYFVGVLGEGLHDDFAWHMKTFYSHTHPSSRYYMADTICSL